MADPETHKPMMTVDGPAGQTLEDWKKIWKDGFVAEEVLAYNEAAYIDAFRSGRYVFSPQQIYDLKTFNDPKKSAAVAGKIGFLPYQGQPWGLIDSAVYLMTSRERPDAVTDDVKRFASWYGYKNEKGEFAVANRWMKENMLFSAYKEVMESARRARDDHPLRSANPADYDQLIEVYSHTPFPKGIWNVVWSEEFNTWLKEKLFAFLQQDLAVADVINQTNDEMTQPQQEVQDQVSLRARRLPGAGPPAPGRPPASVVNCREAAPPPARRRVSEAACGLLTSTTAVHPPGAQAQRRSVEPPVRPSRHRPGPLLPASRGRLSARLRAVAELPGNHRSSAAIRPTTSASRITSPWSRTPTSGAPLDLAPLHGGERGADAPRRPWPCDHRPRPPAALALDAGDHHPALGGLALRRRHPVRLHGARADRPRHRPRSMSSAATARSTSSPRTASSSISPSVRPGTWRRFSPSSSSPAC